MNQVLQERTTVVCAVGDDGSPAAVTVAAAEAVRLQARLLLVRVVPSDEAAPTDAVLDGALVSARTAYPEVTVEAESVGRNWVAGALAGTETGSTHCIVVQRTHRGRLHRLLSGSTAAGIAFEVAAPVLSVPHDWRADEAAAACVTAAVQDAGEVPAVVARAAAEADERGAGLVVLQAVDRAGGYDVADADTRAAWVERAHRDLDDAVRAATAPYPGLDVRIEVVLDRPSDAVVAASARSTLLVTGRRHHEHAWGTHLGPVARRVLLDSACPVLLVADRDLDPVAACDEDFTTPSSTAGIPDTTLVPGDVVVAIGSDDAGGVVRFAVAEAAARGVGVHLVHVVMLPTVVEASTAEMWQQALDYGRRLIGTAAEQARAAGGPDLRVTHRLVERGTVVHDLVAESQHAGAVVIQHRQLSRLRRLVTWSVTNGVAARSDVPVYAVPENWSAAGPQRIGCVVVGLQDADDVEHLLPIALAEAARHDLPLRVVHAGALDPEERASMERSVRETADAWPAVTVHRVFEDADPVDLLVGAVSAPELVVVGRRRHGLPRRSHLGPVARDVLEASTYPVLLAPADDR